jgi:hypothetical protein
MFENEELASVAGVAFSTREDMSVLFFSLYASGFPLARE